MRGWRMKWSSTKLFSVKNYREQKKLLHNPFSYYKALLLKLFTGIHKAPIMFKLKGGGAFIVNEFTTIFIYHEIFVDNCYDIEINNDRKLTIIDIGANTGLFALRAKQIWPDSYLICFEPHPNNYEQLKTNLRISATNNVITINKGLGQKSRKAKMYIHPKNLGAHSIFPQGRDRKSIEIELIDLVSALNYTPEGQCDLLKLDCEGAEYEIIKSLTFELAKNIKRIIYEPMPSIYQPSELNRHLEDLGYIVKCRKGLFFAIRESFGR